MKPICLFVAGSLLAAMLSGCDKSPSGGAAKPGDGPKLVGTWSCVTKSGGAIPDLTDTQTFTADGWYSSSNFPEGKKYQYRVEGGKLVVSLSTGEWGGKIETLTNDSFEYYSDATNKSKVSCRRK